MIGRLIVALQFSDFAAQRLEHVDTILSRGGEDVAHRYLAGAQISALAEDASGIGRDLADSLTAIGDRSRDTDGDFHHRRTEAEALFERQAAALEILQHILHQLQPTIRHVDDQCVEIASRVAGVLERLGKLEDIGHAINLAAMNARIKASRATTARQELAYIAASVNENASVSRGLIDGGIDGLKTLRHALEGEEFGLVRQRLAHLEQALDAAVGNLATSRAREDELERLGQAMAAASDSLRSLIAVSHTELEGMDDLVIRLRELAGQMPVTAADTSGLAAIEPVYSMPREREVHARVTGSGWQADAGQDDLDAVLF